MRDRHEQERNLPANSLETLPTDHTSWVKRRLAAQYGQWLVVVSSLPRLRPSAAQSILISRVDCVSTHHPSIGEKHVSDKTTKAKSARSLRNRHVADSQVTRILSQCQPDRILKYCRWYDFEKRKRPKLGPGWLVAAITNGYRVSSEFEVFEKANDRHVYVKGERRQCIHALSGRLLRRQRSW